MEYEKEIVKELKELSPFLANIREEPTGFKVPENYFDYLSASIMEQVKLEPNSDPIEQPIINEPWYSFLFNRQSLAGLATFTVLLVGALFLLNQPIKENGLAEISSEEATDYIASHLDEFETALFIDTDLLDEISEVEFEFGEQEVNQFLEDNIDELDAATLEQLL